jgi:nucleotide-binding universal stress UspA family protein
MYDRILLPTDGSDAAENAASHAIDIARRYDASIHTVYVVDTSLGVSLNTGEPLRSKLEQEGDAAISRIEELVTEAGVDVTGEKRAGNPHEAILEAARDEDVDLIVMGTHGRTGLDRYLLGSVTERVVRQAEVPVLTVSFSE